MVRKAFIFFNSLSMIVFLLSTIVVLTEAFPLKEVEYEDNMLMLTNAAFVFLLALTSAANFYYFFKNLPPSGYLFIIPATLAGLSFSVAVLVLLAGSVDFLFAIIAAVISMVPLANVFLLKKLGLVERAQVDVSVFD